MMESMDTLANFVRTARNARKLTQEELAEAIDRSIGYVGQLETGRVDRPKPATLRLLAAALEVPLDDLVAATGQIDPAPDEDVADQIRRIAGLPTAQARLDAWKDLPVSLRRDMLKLAQDLFLLGAERLEEE